MKHFLWLSALVVGVVVLAAVVGGRGAGLEKEAEAAPWRYGQSMSQRRSYVAAGEVAGSIYVAGGMVGETGRALHLLQRFDPDADSWTTLRPMPEPLRAAAGATLDGVLYVTGGSTGRAPSPRVYAYDVARDEWEPRAPLPEPRLNHVAVRVGDEIYVLGGLDGDAEEAGDVFVYEPASDTWRRGAPLPRPLHAFGAVVFRGEIWVIGGRRQSDILREVWIHDPEEERWRAGPSMPEPMELLGAAVAGDAIHAVWESTYQIYDARDGSWRQGPRPLVTRHGLQAFAVGERLYTIGGCTTELKDSQVVEARDL